MPRSLLVARVHSLGRVCLAALLLGLTADQLFAQSPAEPSFVRFTVANGLPTPLIRRLATDERGHLWISSSQGLIRYDGYRFTRSVVTGEPDGLRTTPTSMPSRLGGPAVSGCGPAGAACSTSRRRITASSLTPSTRSTWARPSFKISTKRRAAICSSPPPRAFSSANLRDTSAPRRPFLTDGFSAFLLRLAEMCVRRTLRASGACPMTRGRDSAPFPTAKRSADWSGSPKTPSFWALSTGSTNPRVKAGTECSTRQTRCPWLWTRRAVRSG